jgi:putative transcriptional regulator
MPLSGDADRTLRRGVLLVAGPSMRDPNFMHTVVLVCAHGDEGSFGLVLNRPTRPSVSDIQSDVPLLEGRTDKLWGGGPVGTRELHVLHRTGAEIPGSMAVVDGVALDGDPLVLANAVRPAEPETPSIRFFAGYAGWGPGQLEAEMDEQSWIVCPTDPRFVFDGKPDTLWRRVLKAQGGSYAAMAELPPDPSWN